MLKYDFVQISLDKEAPFMELLHADLALRVQTQKSRYRVEEGQRKNTAAGRVLPAVIEMGRRTTPT